jgi:DNA-binding MarR family transcriptional regulator
MNNLSTSDDLIPLPIEEEELVEGLITSSRLSPDSLSVFTGVSVDKIILALLSMAVNNSMGKDWLGHKTRKARILLVDTESGEPKLERKLRDAIHGEVGNNDISGLEYFSLARIKSWKQGGIEKLEKIIEKTGAELIILNAFDDIVHRDDKNTLKDEALIKAMRTISQIHSCAIILIHNLASSRGFYNIKDNENIDLIVKIDSRDNSPDIDFIVIRSQNIEPTKFSAKVQFDDDAFKLVQNYSFFGGDPYLSFLRLDILNYLQYFGPSTLMEILEQYNGISSTICRLLFSLIKAGLVQTAKKNEKILEDIYFITPYGYQIWRNEYGYLYEDLGFGK